MDRQTADRIQGTLGAARRHLAAIRGGQLEPTNQVLEEINRSVERCHAALEAEVRPSAHANAVEELRQRTGGEQAADEESDVNDAKTPPDARD